MSDWGIFYYVLPATAGAFGVLLLTWFVNRRRDVDVCRTGWIVRGIYLIGVFGGMFGIHATVIDNDLHDGLNDEVWLPFAMFTVVLVFVWAFFDALTREISWNSSSLELRKLGFKARTESWEKIGAVRYQPFRQCWYLELDDGKRFGFSEIMSGSNALLEECRRHGLLDD